MKENDLLRQSLTPDLPNPELIRQKILQEPATPKKRRKNLFTVLPAAACIALLITAAALFSHENPLSLPFAAVSPESSTGVATEPVTSSSSHENPVTQPAAVVTPKPSDQETNSSAQPAQPASAYDAYFNTLGSDVASACKLYIDPAKTYTKTLSFSQLLDYLGRDVRPTYLPAGLQGEDVKDQSFTLIYNNDGTLNSGSFSFFYQEKPGNQGYDPLERRLQISVAKGQLFRDCIYTWPDETRESSINGHAVQLGKRKMPYGPYTVVENGPNTPAGYYDLFVAEFQFAGLDYEVVADNLTESEFLAVLASMLPTASH